MSRDCCTTPKVELQSEQSGFGNYQNIDRYRHSLSVCLNCGMIFISLSEGEVRLEHSFMIFNPAAIEAIALPTKQ